MVTRNKDIDSLKKKTQQVFMTQMYSKFEKHPMNRPIIKEDVEYRVLRSSMLRTGFRSHDPIKCVRKGKMLLVMDGHRRLIIAEELRLPVYYMILSPKEVEGMTPVDLTIGWKPWTVSDYMNTYCDMMKEEYIKLKAFREKYRLPVTVSIALLCGDALLSTVAVGAMLRDGTFKVLNMEYAERVANACEDLAKTVSRYAKNKSFICALGRAMELEEFDLSKFVERAKKRPSMFVPQAGQSGYSKMIEDIYNRQHPKDAISIAFTSQYKKAAV